MLFANPKLKHLLNKCDFACLVCPQINHMWQDKQHKLVGKATFCQKMNGCGLFRQGGPQFLCVCDFYHVKRDRSVN